MSDLRVGIADHLGWAVAVTASTHHEVIDRRRIELIEPGLPPAPVHHVGGPHTFHRQDKPLDDEELAALVDKVRASVSRATASALDELAAIASGAIVSISLRDWPDDFPDDIAVQRRPPYESRADPIMYRRVLADAAHARGWVVRRYDAKRVEDEAVRLLAGSGDRVCLDQRSVLGPPWSRDHRIAFASTVMAT